MATATDGGEQIILPSKAHGGDDVGDIGAASDEQRPLVNHAVVELAGLFVLLVAALDEVTPEARF